MAPKAEWIGTTEAAGLLGMMPQSVRALAARGELKARKVMGPSGREEYRIDPDSIDARVAEHAGGGGLLTRAEVLELLGWSPAKLGAAIRHRRIRPVDVDGVALFPRAQLEPYVVAGAPAANGSRPAAVAPRSGAPDALALVGQIEGLLRELRLAIARDGRDRSKRVEAAVRAALSP